MIYLAQMTAFFILLTEVLVQRQACDLPAQGEWPLELQLEASGHKHSLSQLGDGLLRRRPKEKKAAIESLWLEYKFNAPFPNCESK